jgi:hypothetical protein
VVEVEVVDLIQLEELKEVIQFFQQLHQQVVEAEVLGMVVLVKVLVEMADLVVEDIKLQRV